jgi:hypothetical protein
MTDERNGQTIIRDEITAPPTVYGRHGRAWTCNIAVGLKMKNIPPEKSGTLVHWVVEAPWAHPVWHSYSIVLVHLRPIKGLQAPVIYLDGATHEIWVDAMNPDQSRNRMIETGIVDGEWLRPKNFAAQFIEPADDMALSRVFLAVQAICDGKLSPDTDFRRQWEGLFGDNMVKK